MRGAFWPLQRGFHVEDLYARPVTVYRNRTAPPINRQNQAEYIWMIEDAETGRKLARATEVPLVGKPLVWVTSSDGPVLTGSIPPGQMVIRDADAVARRDWGRRITACILTSDGEVWTGR